MRISLPRSSAFPLLALVFLAGCAGAAGPYVHNPNEFNRASPNFGKELTDRGGVDICYNRSFTSAADVVALAVRECGHFGKSARFIRSEVFQCSVLAPVRAVYQCMAPPATGDGAKFGQRLS